jgi:hypothetical protein
MLPYIRLDTLTSAAQTVEENKVVLLKQVSRETMQVVTSLAYYFDFLKWNQVY